MAGMHDKVLTAYRIYPHEKRVRIAPCPAERAWMDKTQDAFAYRCLPLNIANQHGWAVSAAQPISAVWNGGNHTSDVRIPQDAGGVAASAFGNGVLTFHIMHLIKLPPHYSLFISGAPNTVKRGIVPLTGIFEADWAPYSFTMNWKFTDVEFPVRFEAGEPFCFFFPVERNLIEQFQFKFDDLANAPEIKTEHDIWKTGRRDFLDRIDEHGGGWQKNYFQGRMPSGGKCPHDDHKTKLKLSAPKHKGP